MNQNPQPKTQNPKLLFGTAGIPYSTKKRSTTNGILQVKTLNLDAMEIQFTHGINLNQFTAEPINKIAKENKIALSCHAPYYINLNSAEMPKQEASKTRILNSAKIANFCGARSVVFHPGYFGKSTKQDTYQTIKQNIQEIVEILKQENNKIILRPETVGKASQFGDINETIQLSQEIDQVLPCIDFSHVYARSIGKINTQQAFAKHLELVEKHLGKQAINNMHIHMSGIEYGPKGERYHTQLEDSNFNFKAALLAIKQFNVKGIIINESKINDVDALLLKETYSKL